jgi:hypothetical protein
MVAELSPNQHHLQGHWHLREGGGLQLPDAACDVPLDGLVELGEGACLETLVVALQGLAEGFVNCFYLDLKSVLQH